MHVIIFGSLNTDLCYQLDDFPLAGETISALNFTVLNGGKGANQAVSAARSGANTVMIGAVGDDDYGSAHIEALNSEGINTQHIARENAPTGTANIYINKAGENNIVLNAGANGLSSAAQLKQCGLNKGDILIVQMEISHNEIIGALAYAKSCGAMTILNLAPAPKIFPDGLLDNVDYLIANELEAQSACTQIAPKSDQMSLSYAEQAKLISVAMQSHCIITLGADGVYAYMTDGTTYTAPAMPIDAQDLIDTTGAGDAFAGAFAAALSKDRGDVGGALRFAAYAGSLACLKLGAQSALPHAAAVIAALNAPHTDIAT
jgi:ribokinase